MNFAGHQTYLHVFQILQCMHRSQLVGDMAVAVFKIAEHTVAGYALLDLLCHPRAQCAVHSRARLSESVKQKWQIGKIQFRHAVGEIAGRLVRQRQHAVFRHPQQIGSLIAEIHYVPHVMYGDIFAELICVQTGNRVAYHFHAATAGGGRRAVAAHGDAYGVAHVDIFRDIKV